MSQYDEVVQLADQVESVVTIADRFPWNAIPNPDRAALLAEGERRVAAPSPEPRLLTTLYHLTAESDEVWDRLFVLAAMGSRPNVHLETKHDLWTEMWELLCPLAGKPPQKNAAALNRYQSWMGDCRAPDGAVADELGDLADALVDYEKALAAWSCRGNRERANWASLRRDLQKRKADRQESLAPLRRVQEEKSRLQGEIDDLLKREQTLTRKAAEAERSQKAAAARMAAHVDQTSKSELRLKDIESELAQHGGEQARFERLDQDLRAAQTAKANLDGELASARKDIERLQLEYGTHRETSQRVEQDLRGAEAAKVQLERELAKAHMRTSDLDLQVKSLKGELQDEERKYGGDQVRLKELEGERERARAARAARALAPAPDKTSVEAPRSRQKTDGLPPDLAVLVG